MQPKFLRFLDRVCCRTHGSVVRENVAEGAGHHVAEWVSFRDVAEDVAEDVVEDVANGMFEFERATTYPCCLVDVHSHGTPNVKPR